MQTITIIIGLPGSGKTTYIKNNSEEFKNAVICDDYHKSSYKKSHEFKDSIYYQDLLTALKDGKDVVLTDIVWCKSERLKILEENVKEVLEKLEMKAKINYIYFENNREACKKNVLQRNRSKEKVEREIELIDAWSPQYVIPQNALIVPIVAF
ncbi:MAG: AAA family ATPase [Candidatus Paceibacterota bacterium]